MLDIAVFAIQAILLVIQFELQHHGNEADFDDSKSWNSDDEEENEEEEQQQQIEEPEREQTFRLSTSY